MTVVPGRVGVAPAIWVGLALALALAVCTTWLFVLALVVWQQGLPQDYDTIATTSTEAMMVSQLTLLGLLLCPALFIGSIVCLSRPASRSRAVTAIRVAATLLLAVSVGFGVFSLRTWGGFGW